MDGSGRVMHWNKEAEKYTGIKETEARGQAIRDIFPLIAEEIEKAKTAIKERRPVKNEKIEIIRNGETYFSNVTVYPFTSDGVEGAVIRNPLTM